MNIMLTTYIDNEKLLFEKHKGAFFEDDNFYKIEYVDKNKKKFKIIIDKQKDNVSIVKEDSTLFVEKQRTKTEYKSEFGILGLETQLISNVVKQRNSIYQFEITYYIYFSKIDKQENKLKIVVNTRQ